MKELRLFALAPAALLVVCAAAPAQYPPGAAGFSISTDLGTFAGNFCWGFSCTPAAATVTAGEVVTIRISGEWQRPYLLGASTSATSCQPLPGIANSLVIDAPIVVIASGTLAAISPILSCPPGYHEIVAVVPPGIPPGTNFAIQALTWGAGDVLALTGAIVLTVI